MHDGGWNFKTAAALPLILEALGKAGYRFVTVPELLQAWDQWLAAQPATPRLASAPPGAKPYPATPRPSPR